MTTENNIESRDALDEVRIWIGQWGSPFSTLEMEIVIEDGIAMVARINRGGETIRLQKGDLSKPKVKLNNKKSEKHF